MKVTFPDKYNIKTFAKAQVASLTATLADFSSTIILKEVFGIWCCYKFQPPKNICI